MLAFLLLLSETYAISVFYVVKDYINGIINQLVIFGITTISFCNCYAVNHLSHTVKVGWLVVSIFRLSAQIRLYQRRSHTVKPLLKLEMWANAQRDGRPAEYRCALCSMPQSLADAHY